VKLALGFVIVFFATAMLIHYRASSSSYAAKIDHELHRMASKIVHLKREARKAHALEMEDERLEGELTERTEALRRKEEQLAEAERKERLERTQLQARDEQLLELKERLVREEREKDDEIRRLVGEVRSARARSKLRGDGADPVTSEMERRLRAMFGDVQARSRRRAWERYGPGPHRVAMEINVPPLHEIWPDRYFPHDPMGDDDDGYDGDDDNDDNRGEDSSAAATDTDAKEGEGDDDQEEEDDDDGGYFNDDCAFPEEEFFSDDTYGPGGGCQPSILRPSQTVIIFEMASLDYMPHSVELFLDQVDEGLWDNTYFVRNAAHVLQATPKVDVRSPWISQWDKPQAKSEQDALNLTQNFVDADLMHVQFQEYHHSFPHEKYTVGFAGRPGGPMFYINKRDNTDAHGPGGQMHGFGKWDDAEPCFAKVVGGFEAVRWMANVPVDRENHEGLDRMRRYIRIRRAWVIGDNEEDDDEDEEDEEDGSGKGGSREKSNIFRK